MAVGIYSGTFDPIHEGHVLFAQVASEQFGLDTILFMPEPQPRYKKNVSTLDDRLAMINLATEDAAHMKSHHVIGVEQHTITEVIADVVGLYPNDELYLLMGSDVFRTIESWGEREDELGSIADIASAVGFVVGIQSVDEASELKEIAAKTGVTLRMLEVPVPGLSSSKIRKAITGAKPPKGLNATVKTYIETVSLYT